MSAEDRTTKEINHYYVEISDGRGLIPGKNEFRIKALTVLGENDNYLVVDNWNFTTISKEKKSYQESLDVPSISASAADKVWGSRITYSLFTERRKRATTIVKEVDEYVRAKFGFFLNGLDLSIIKDYP